jgi:predicted acyltransferase
MCTNTAVFAFTFNQTACPLKQRFYSLDVFRGATVALMILVNNPGSWANIFSPLEHAPWHGCTPTDLVFPFFLFAVGNAMAFVIPKLRIGGSSLFWKKVLKRFALIFLIGLFLNWSPFVVWQNDHLAFKGWTWTDSEGQLHGIRVLGVLQRIAICYLLASILVFYLGLNASLYISGFLLLLYWFLCHHLGTGTDPYSLKGYFGTNVDIRLFGQAHVYRGEGLAFDPEGLASTLPAVTNVVFGYAAGAYIRRKSKMYNMLAHLFVVGALLVFGGFAWDLVFPINKKIWSSSYVLYTTGLALMTIGVTIYALEFRSFHERRWNDTIFDLAKWLLLVTALLMASVYTVVHFRNQPLFTFDRFLQFSLLAATFTFILSVVLLNRWSNFFNAFGKNPLFIFVLSGFLPRLLALIRLPNGINASGTNQYLNPFSWWYQHICKPLSGNLNIGSLMYAISMVLFFWAIAWAMNKNRIYVKV